MEYFECITFDEAWETLQQLKKERKVEGYSLTKDPGGPWWLGVIFMEDVSDEG